MTTLPDVPTPLALWAIGGVILVLLVFAAFLKTSGAALAAAGRGRLYGLADRGERRAVLALALSADAEGLTAALLVGSSFATMLAAALSTAVLTRLTGGAGVLLAAAGMTVLTLVIVEAAPLAWAARRPEATALRVARPVAALARLLSPAAAAAAGAARLLIAPFGPPPDSRGGAPGGTAESADPPVEVPAEEEERERLLGALDLGERQVEEVMMHRRDIEMIDAEAPPDEILAQALNSAHTRLPIFRGEPENIVGVIHAKDLSRAVHRFAREHQDGALEGFDIMDAAMPPYFVPESTALDDQLREFLRRRTHFALVVDEYGALQGLVTLEDIIEEIVGNISDEHDVDAPSGIERQPDGSVEVEGSVTIRDLNRACDWTLPDDEANTIAGLVIHQAQSIPNEGDAFAAGGFRFEVLAREGNRLARLRVRPVD